MNFDKTQFGKRFRAFRKSLGLTQAELAARLDTTQGNIGHIENGRRKPGAEVLANLYLEHRDSFEYLLLGSSDEPRQPENHPTQIPSSHIARRIVEPHRQLLPPLISLLESVEKTVKTLNRFSDTYNPQEGAGDPE